MSYQENQISDLIDAGIELEKEMLDSISVTYSRGRAKYGRKVYFVMPNSQNCRNRSRRIVAQDGDQAYYKLIEVIKKWYFPLSDYTVDGLIICSNSNQMPFQNIGAFVKRIRWELILRFYHAVIKKKMINSISENNGMITVSALC